MLCTILRAMLHRVSGILASFSTRNSTLNTSLRKPIRMQDFIQLCDSRHYDSPFIVCSVITW